MQEFLSQLVDNDYIFDYKKIVHISFFMYILAGFFANDTWLFWVFAILFMLMEFLYIVKSKTFYLSNYTGLGIILFIYIIWQNNSGVTLNTESSQLMLEKLILNSVLAFFTLSYILREDNVYKLPKVFSQAGFVFGIYILLTNITNLQTGRLGWEQEYIFNLKGNYESNIIGAILAFAFIMYLYRILVNTETKCTLASVLCIILVFFTGSRRAIFIVFVGTVLMTFWLYMGKKKLKTIVTGIIVTSLMYVAITEIDVFYNAVGFRVEALFVEVEDEEKLEQSECTTEDRNRLIELGLEKIRENPYTGIGLDNFRLEKATDNMNAHNNYIELLVDVGILGFILYYIVYIIALIKSFVAHFRRMKIGTLSVVCIILMLAFEYGTVTYNNRIFQLIIIFSVAVGIVTERENKLFVENDGEEVEDVNIFIDEFGEERLI